MSRGQHRRRNLQFVLAARMRSRHLHVAALLRHVRATFALGLGQFSVRPQASHRRISEQDNCQSENSEFTEAVQVSPDYTAFHHLARD